MALREGHVRQRWIDGEAPSGQSALCGGESQGGASLCPGLRYLSPLGYPSFRPEWGMDFDTGIRGMGVSPMDSRARRSCHAITTRSVTGCCFSEVVIG